MQNVKGRDMSGSIRARAERMAYLRVLKAEWIFDFSPRDSEKSSLLVDIGIVPRGQN